MSVLDASVVLKWFVDEKGSNKALSLRKDFREGKTELILPDLALYEISNALRYNPEFGKEEIQVAIKTLVDMDMDIVTPTLPLIKASIELAIEHEITCYDATYFALARELEFSLITADEKFFHKLPEDSRNSDQVKLLSDL